MDFKESREKFSIFENYKKAWGQDLIYLDSASASLTPDKVVHKINDYYLFYRSNLEKNFSKSATVAREEYEQAKKLLAKYLNCDKQDLIWTSSSTMSSNILMQMLAKANDFLTLESGDEILTTIMEHHSTLLPLQELAKAKNLELKYLKLDSYYDLDLENLADLVSSKTKIVAITLASNVLGTVNNLQEILSRIKRINPRVFVISDLTQAFGHMAINLKELSPWLDAGYFSLQKAYGPTGVGVLYLKRTISRLLTPVILGGGIVAQVGEKSFALRSDEKVFEAGTSNFSGIIASGEAVRFLMTLEGEKGEISQQNSRLVEYFFKKVKNFNLRYEREFKIEIFARSGEHNLGIISWRVFRAGKEISSLKLAQALAEHDIVVRAGYQCAEPLMHYLGTEEGLVRVSFNIYNQQAELVTFFSVLERILKSYSNLD